MDEEKTSKYRNYEFRCWRRVKAWYAWQVFLPLCCIVFAIPVYCLIGEARARPWITRLYCGFNECFSRGDLVLYSALLLVGVEIEIRRVIKLDRKLKEDKYLYLRAEFSKLYSMILLGIYAFFKCWYQQRAGVIEVSLRSMLSLGLAASAIVYAAGGMYLSYEKLITWAWNKINV